MQQSTWSPEVKRGRCRLVSGLVIVAAALVAGLWVTMGDGDDLGVSGPSITPAGAGREFSSGLRGLSGVGPK